MNKHVVLFTVRSLTMNRHGIDCIALLVIGLDPEVLRRCEMIEIEKYFDDRWVNEQYRFCQRRSSNEDEGVEEDFSSSGSGIENPTNTSKTNRDFEELTQMMRNSLTGFDNTVHHEHRPATLSTMSKTYC
jgi:hypothetical protein